MILYISDCERDTISLGKKIGELAHEGTIILLSGDLGAGKTVFAKGIAEGLDIKDPITSPTYTLIHQYVGRFPLYHFDIYRLGDEEEMYDLGYEEYFYGDGVALVEWPERLGSLYPHEYIGIVIKKTDDDKKREIYINTIGKKYSKLEEALKTYDSTGH